MSSTAPQSQTDELDALLDRHTSVVIATFDEGNPTPLLDIEDDIKKALIEWRDAAVREARIDELKKYLDHYKDDYDRYADSRIAELTAQKGRRDGQY